MQYKNHFSKIVVVVFVGLILPMQILWAQQNNYRSKSNANYWKNKTPFKGYWQQDIAYTIQAKIDETTDVIEGSEQLIYWNNSPDQLPFVYFHLYQNAFQPESHYHQLHKDNNIDPHFGHYESQKKGTELLSIQVEGKELSTEYQTNI